MANRKSTIKDSLTKATAAAKPNAATDEEILPRDGYTRPVGIGLKENEIAAIDEIADHYDVSRHSLMVYAIRQFIIGHIKGEVDLSDRITEPPKKQNKLNL